MSHFFSIITIVLYIYHGRDMGPDSRIRFWPCLSTLNGLRRNK